MNKIKLTKILQKTMKIFQFCSFFHQVKDISESRTVVLNPNPWMIKRIPSPDYHKVYIAKYTATNCTRSLDPIYVVTYCIRWFKTSWTNSMYEICAKLCAIQKTVSVPKFRATKSRPTSRPTSRPRFTSFF